MGRDYRQPRMLELWSFASKPEAGAQVQKGAPYRADIDRMMERFQSGVLSQTGYPLTLKYSGVLGPVPQGGNVLLLGWDHVAHLQRDSFSGRYFLRAVYSHSYSEIAPDTHAYRLDNAKGKGKPLCDKISPVQLPKDKHKCEKHKSSDCVWQKYELPPLDSSNRIWIRELITFGVSSCSFVTLWDEAQDHLFVGHLDAPPIVPLAWLAVEELKPFERAWMRMLATVRTEADELTKFTDPGRFPYADRLAIDSVLLLRGPKGGDVYMGHPYIGLDLSQPQEVTFQGILGYNNSKVAGDVMPPFHSLLGEFMPVLANSQSAAEIMDVMARLLRSEFGFGDLHHEVMNQLAIGIFASSAEKRKPWSSPRLKKLLGQVSGGVFSKAVPVPSELSHYWPKQGAEAAFLFAELLFNPKLVPDWVQQAVIDGWTAHQRGFEFRLKHHASWEQK